MSKICMSNKTKKSHFPIHIISDSIMLFDFILSHPLYFSYFLFFSPYILKLLSFLSPLFVTTSLLLVGFLTLSPTLANQSSISEEPKKGFLVSAYNNIFETLSPKAGHDIEELSQFEEFELYKIVFEVSMYNEVPELNCEEKFIGVIEANECNPVGAIEAKVDVCSRDSESNIVLDSFGMSDENPQAVSQPFVKAKVFWQGKSNFDCVLCDKDEKEDKPVDSKTKQVIAKTSFGDDEVMGCSQRQEAYLQRSSNIENYASKLVKEDSRSLEANLVLNVNDDDSSGKVNGSFSPNLSCFGSLRNEKEWRRTLACKLFEERHHVHVGRSEGMDLLWETYESTESMKVKAKGSEKKGRSYYDDEDEDGDGQLCCLQALKFSAGKMNRGMGRPNLVKISKAFKGIGWLQSMSRRSKKENY